MTYFCTDEIKERKKQAGSSQHEHDTFEDKLLGFLRDSGKCIAFVTKMKGIPVNSEAYDSYMRMTLLHGVYAMGWLQLILDDINRFQPYDGSHGILDIIRSQEFISLFTIAKDAHSNLPGYNTGWLTKLTALTNSFGQREKGKKHEKKDVTQNQFGTKSYRKATKNQYVAPKDNRRFGSSL